MATHQIVTFFLNEHFFGVPVEVVQEVIRSSQQTRVPLAHHAVGGLINLRGQILTTIDLRRRLDLIAGGDLAPPVQVVLKTADGAVALLVDRMGDVLDVDQDRFESLPETLDPRIGRLIECVCNLDGQLLLILDTENAVDLSVDTDSPV